MTADLSELVSVARELGEDEVHVLVTLARRLAHGRKVYGPLDVQGDPRDWRREASEEALDLAVYLACETMRKAAGDMNAARIVTLARRCVWSGDPGVA